jgi:hypothetical protein
MPHASNDLPAQLASARKGHESALARHSIFRSCPGHAQVSINKNKPTSSHYILFLPNPLVLRAYRPHQQRVLLRRSLAGGSRSQQSQHVVDVERYALHGTKAA